MLFRTLFDGELELDRLICQTICSFWIALILVSYILATKKIVESPFSDLYS